MSRKVMNQSHTIFLYNFLKKVCKKRGDYCVYKDENTDASVAERCSIAWSEKNTEPYEYTAVNVASVRRALFGNLYEKPAKKNSNIEARVKKLEELVATLVAKENTPRNRRPQSSPPDVT